jgi:poly(beta-D-mannuronate) lyase
VNASHRFSALTRSGLVLLASLPLTLFAATEMVDSLAALQSTIHRAAPGDTIILRNGVYTTSSPLTVRRAGTPEAPITITAETVGGVEITGTHGFNLAAPAAHIIISGFTFTHAAGRSTIGVDTSHVRFTRNTFQCTGEGAYLSVIGDDAQIDYNEFGEKKTGGSMLAIGGTGSQVARRLWVHHNFFHDLSSLGSSSAEMIRYGLSAMSPSNGAGLVEHNLFARCRGEAEMISSRASGITYRYNTFVDSPSAQFTLRHGNDCSLYGNILRNTEGLRIYGDRHHVYSNYFERNYIGINLGNGSADVATGASLALHDRPDDCIIAFNTLVDNRTHYQMSRRAPAGLGASRITFSNNLLQGGGTAVKIEGPYVDGVWQGNILWNVADLLDIPAGAFVIADPLLTPDSDGIKRIQAGSSANAAALGAFARVTVDFEGQPRPERMSVGADEISEESSAARLLSPNHVGPQAAIFQAIPPSEPTPSNPDPRPNGGPPTPELTSPPPIP